jgi:dTDP-4-amino-4,6-dideoxygalactose transaminase
MVMAEKVLQIPFVDLGAQYSAHADEIHAALLRVIQKTAFVLGPEVAEFEKAFAKYCDVQYAIGVDSGTSALQLALEALDIGAGDEVITAANTFIATALAITYTGAKPVLVDIDPQSYTIEPDLIEKAITPRTKAIIPVHLFGHPAAMARIQEIASAHGLEIIEDACQAHGARYRGKRAGGFGKAAAFSFYPAKNLGAFGDAGMVVTNDEKVYKTVRMLRDVGQSKKYYHDVKGYNHRLDALQAAVLGVKLPYLDMWNGDRRENAALYDRLLAGSGVEIPVEAEDVEAVYHLYVIRTPNRQALQAYLSENGVSTGIHYPIPIHLQAAYQDLGYQRGDLPVTEAYADQILSLPMFAELTPEQIEYVAATIRRFQEQ